MSNPVFCFILTSDQSGLDIKLTTICLPQQGGPVHARPRVVLRGRRVGQLLRPPAQGRLPRRRHGRALLRQILGADRAGQPLAGGRRDAGAAAPQGEVLYDSVSQTTLDVVYKKHLKFPSRLVSKFFQKSHSFFCLFVLTV